MTDGSEVLPGSADGSGAPVLYQSGRFRFIMDAGQLRWLSCDGVEIVRGIAFLVRDRNWATLPTAAGPLEAHAREDGLDLAFRSVIGTDYELESRIAVQADGITYSVTCTVGASAEVNRLGFVVLHPLEGFAGGTASIGHPSGAIETRVLPELVHPVQPATDIVSIAVSPRPTLTVTVAFEGETYEMEDQRNWTDASFKTYVRPLSKGWPYAVTKGQRIVQVVKLGVSPRTARAAAVTTRTAPPQSVRMPSIALRTDTGSGFDSAETRITLETVRPQHLLVRHDPRASFPGALEGLARVASDLGIALDLEAIVDGPNPAAEVATLAEFCRARGVSPASVFLPLRRDLLARFPGREPEVDAQRREVAEHGRRAFPDARIGVGTPGHFNELNSNPPAEGQGDFITHVTSANVHAADDAAVMETLESLPAVFASGRRMAGTRGYRVGLAAIAMAENPYGAGRTLPNPDDLLLPTTRRDPRHYTSFGAAFAVAYAIEAARGRVDVLCLAHLGGDLGLRDTRTGERTPLFHAIRALSEVGGRTGRVVPDTRGCRCFVSDTDQIALVANASGDADRKSVV